MSIVGFVMRLGDLLNQSTIMRLKDFLAVVVGVNVVATIVVEILRLMLLIDLMVKGVDNDIKNQKSTC